MIQTKQINDFADSVLELNSKDEVIKFFEWLLTPQEFKQLPMRLQIMRMLKKGIPQRKIAETLGVGIATVTRGSKELEKYETIIAKVK